MVVAEQDTDHAGEEEKINQLKDIENSMRQLELDITEEESWI